MKKIIAILFIFIIPINTFGFSGFGESVGLDLYKKIDQGNFEIKKSYLEKELKGSAEKLNKILDFDWFKQDFTASEMEEILSGGGIDIIMSHMKDEFLNGAIRNEELNQLSIEISKLYKQIKEKIDIKTKEIQTISSIGLYTDGKLENSDYDLMYDLENIHKIIFASDIAYNGVENNNFSMNIGDLFSSSNDDIISNIKNGENSGNNNSFEKNLEGEDKNLSKINLNDENTTKNDPIYNSNEIIEKNTSCKTGTIIKNLDTNFIQKINNQLIYGNNSSNIKNNVNNKSNLDNTELLQGSKEGGKGGKSGGGSGGGGSLYDTFNCNGIFCIKIEFVMYMQKLLGGKTDSIEGILSKNFKIIHKIASQSLIQSEMTQVFMTLDLLKKLKLQDLLHLFTVVKWLPPPILNLKPKTEKENQDLSNLKEFSNKDLLINTFKQNGLDYKKQNKIISDKESKIIENYCENQKIVGCSYKFGEIYSPKEEFNQSIKTKLKQNYFDGFDKDLVELRTFTIIFKSLIIDIISISKEMGKKAGG